MTALGLRYNRAAEDVSKSVKEAHCFFEGIFSEIGASKRCSVIFSSKESTYAYHRFDDVCVVTFLPWIGANWESRDAAIRKKWGVWEAVLSGF